jgi:hypothetical protein
LPDMTTGQLPPRDRATRQHPDHDTPLGWSPPIVER